MSATRITTPTQQGARLSWLSDLFERCSNAVEQPSTVNESLPVPEVCESSWLQWDAAVSDLDQIQAGRALS